jgi:hypothetical protein
MPENEVCTYRLSSSTSFDMKIEVSSGNVANYDTELFLYDGYKSTYTSKGNLTSGSIQFTFGGNTKEYLFVVVVPKTGGSPFWFKTSDETYVFPWWAILIICLVSFFFLIGCFILCIVTFVLVMAKIASKQTFGTQATSTNATNLGMAQPGLFA